MNVSSCDMLSDSPIFTTIQIIQCSRSHFAGEIMTDSVVKSQRELASPHSSLFDTPTVAGPFRVVSKDF